MLFLYKPIQEEGKFPLKAREIFHEWEFQDMGSVFLGVDSLLYFLSKKILQREMLLLFQETYLNQEKKEIRGKSLNIQLLWYISSC